MSGKRIAGVVCFVVATGYLIAGVVRIMDGPDVMHESGLGVSHAVGALLPAILALILGVWLFQKKP